jgi:two-component system sensor histidine kinase HydH
MRDARQPSISVPSLDPIQLNQAFARFEEASGKLQARYAQLLKETELLREQLKQKEETIRRSEKLATLGQMAAALAHEVRNPLGAMRLFISLLRRDVADRPEALTLVGQVDKTIESLDLVVSNMLHFAKDEKLQRAPCNLQSIAQEVVEQFRALYPHEKIFNLVVRGSPFLLANPVRLKQALHNVVLNAVEAIAGRGQIQIDIDGSSTERLILTVQDSGPGVSSHMLTHLFEPFQTSKNEGTGLGLAVVKAVCDEHMASIEVENRPGAQFRLTFPRQ